MTIDEAMSCSNKTRVSKSNGVITILTGSTKLSIKVCRKITKTFLGHQNFFGKFILNYYLRKSQGNAAKRLSCGFNHQFIAKFTAKSASEKS